MRKILGRNKQVNCSINDFYKFLGYLASHPEDVRIVFENNSEQGAWGNEGRIQFREGLVRNYFKPLGIGVTAGVGNVYDSRLNCNELFEELITLGFVKGSSQNITDIRKNIPPKYIVDFDAGTRL